MMQSPRGRIPMSDKEFKQIKIELQEVDEYIHELKTEILELGATPSKLDRLGGLYIRQYQLELEIRLEGIYHG